MAKRMAFVTVLAFGMSVTSAMAQCACGVAERVYAPAVSTYTVLYASPVTPTVTYYAPTVAAPTVAYYPPVTTTYYAPTAVAAPVVVATPTVAYYPTVTTTYYAPTAYTTYSPVVTSYATYYAAPAVAPREVVGTSMYGTTKVYVRGEPVRNAVRATTP